MNLLQQIQGAVINPSTRIVDVLRLCKILAGRLKHQAFKEWVDQELNGYVNGKMVPEYRIVRGLSCYGSFKRMPLLPLLEDVKLDFSKYQKEVQELMSTRWMT